MRFTWDEGKRVRNLHVHGLDFADVHSVFAEWTITLEDDRFIYYEQRFVTLGLRAGVPVAVVHTETEETVHVISFRKATRREAAFFFESFRN
jgi:uncharacterized DUF497 family protein